MKRSDLFDSVAGVNDGSTLQAPAAAALARAPHRLRLIEIVVMAAASAAILTASYAAWWAIRIDEAWGFVTGGICVWLVVREHLWNWPIGLANNVAFFVLFWRGRLYADMGLQIVYLALGLYGWLNWLFGGADRSLLAITRTRRAEWICLAIAIPVSVWALRAILIAVNGAAPFWDSLTTVLSLAAQYLLCRKRFENWFLWIAADLIYVPLYLSRQLPLTAALYAVFLIVCLIGVREWRRAIRGGEARNLDLASSSANSIRRIAGISC